MMWCVSSVRGACRVDQVRLAEQGRQVGRNGAERPDLGVVDERIMGQHAHLEAGQLAHHRPADGPEADDAQRGAGDAMDGVGCGDVPGTPAHRTIMRDDAPGSCQQQCDGLLGDFVRAEADDVGNDDAALGRGGDVDVVDAGAVAGDNTAASRPSMTRRLMGLWRAMMASASRAASMTSSSLWHCRTSTLAPIDAATRSSIVYEA